MRLAVVSPFVDRHHGTERALAELLERLARNYLCEIHLYSQRVEDLALGPSTASGSQKTGSIIWHKVPSIPGPHLLQFSFWLLANALCRGWDRKIRGLRFDLVLSPGINCFDADVVVVHALFHRLREFAAEGVGALAAAGLFRSFHRRAYYALLTWLELCIYTSSQVYLIAVSQRTTALLQQYFHRPDVRVIPNGVDAGQFSPERRFALRPQARSRCKFQENDVVLLLIGNDWHNKGLSTVLAAMAACHDIPVHLLVAGQDASASTFLETAAELGLREQCRWETACVEAIDLYAAADLYVSPSREDSFGLPVLEAMACGLPVITSGLAGVSEIITDGKNGFVLQDPCDVAALTALLRKLCETPELCRQIGQRAARTARAYDWDRNARETWEFLMAALEKKRTAKTPRTKTPLSGSF